jgi:hypothetical protein
MVVKDDAVTHAFDFVNVTLNEFADKRLPQKILIDVGEPEEDPYATVSAPSA